MKFVFPNPKHCENVRGENSSGDRVVVETYGGATAGRIRNLCGIYHGKPGDAIGTAALVDVDGFVIAVLRRARRTISLCTPVRFETRRGHGDRQVGRQPGSNTRSSSPRSQQPQQYYYCNRRYHRVRGWVTRTGTNRRHLPRLFVYFFFHSYSLPTRRTTRPSSFHSTVFRVRIAAAAISFRRRRRTPVCTTNSSGRGQPVAVPPYDVSSCRRCVTESSGCNDDDPSTLSYSRRRRGSV